MGSTEFTRRWTVRFCGALAMLVFLMCTVMIGDKRTGDQRRDKGLVAVGHNLSHYEPPSMSQVVTPDRVVSVNSLTTPQIGVNALTEDPSHSTDEDQVFTNTDSINPSQNSEPIKDPARLAKPPKLRAKFTPLTSSGISQLRMFVLFVGFARSGHSIIGSLLDAHPDIIIAHEYNALKDIRSGLGTSKRAVLSLVNQLYRNSHKSAVSGWRSEKRSTKGYTLSVSGGSWQGRIRRLRVVGDKAAGKTAKEHMQDTTKCLKLVKMMNTSLGATVKAIRVLRNPYDIIATRVLYNTMTVNEIANARNSSKTVKYKRPAELSKQTERFFQLASQVNKMITQCHLPVHDVHLADLVHQPRSVMRELCDTVQVECFAEYLDLCEEKVFKSLSKTRYLVEWSQKQIEAVARKIRTYPEFSRYSYHCDC